MARVAVIGAGLMGASWAALALAHGHKVMVSDSNSDAISAIEDYVAKAFPALRELGAACAADYSTRLIFTGDNAEAAGWAEFIQENGPENLDSKKALIAELDSAASADAIIASSSSGFYLSQLREGCANSDRVVIGHPFNPPHLIPLVEIVGTSEVIVQRACAFYRGLGKTPIVLRKEIKGHVVNRLQSAIWREAVHLISEGVVSVADIDAAVTGSFGLRSALIGPNLNYGLAGGDGGFPKFLDMFSEPVAEWWADLGTPELTPQIRALLIEGFKEQLGNKSIVTIAAERDEWLVAVQRLLKQRAMENMVPPHAG